MPLGQGLTDNAPQEEEEEEEEEEVPSPPALRSPMTSSYRNDSPRGSIGSPMGISGPTGPNLPPRTFTKARPLSERENKFTSTLRRLSTVRKRNKQKRKTKERDMASNGDSSGIEAASVGGASGNPAETSGTSGNTSIQELRPSSTTSRESEGEAALTSGYFRYIYLPSM